MLIVRTTRVGTGLEQPLLKCAESVTVTPTAPPASKSFKGWEQLWPTLALGAAGATYGAIKSPGDSPLRGALAGGLAGAGAGAAFTGTHQLLASQYGSLMNENNAVNAGLLLGSAGLGGLGGLRAGRLAADKLNLPDKNKDDELDELDLVRPRKGWKPGNLSSYFRI